MRNNIVLISAVDENYGIGYKGELLTHLPQDLKKFKEVTEGHIVVMGRKTFDSIGKPLPNRRNIVLSSTMEPQEGVEVIRRPEEVYEIESEGLIFILGGTSLYKYFERYAKAILLTRLHREFEKVDTWFPKIDYTKWNLSAKEFHEYKGLPFSFERYIINR